MKRWWALALAGVSFAASAAEPLRFAMGESWAMPLIELRQGRPTRGILLDLMQRIAAHAGAEPIYVSLPAKRVDLALHDGSVDLHCYLSPKWYAEPEAPARWSVPLLSVDDVLLGPPDHVAAVADLASLHHARLGTVLGYRYPTLEPWFAAGNLVRDDVGTQLQVLEKLARGRTELGVSNRLATDWYNKGRLPNQRVRPLQVIESTQTHCLLAVQPRLAPERILAAVRRLADSGEVAIILQRYR